MGFHGGIELSFAGWNSTYAYGYRNGRAFADGSPKRRVSHCKLGNFNLSTGDLDMVSNVTSLTGNGLKDWLIQRVTALYLMVYSIYLFFFLFCHPHLSYESWAALFHCTTFKIATIVALFAVLMHAWVGLWTVTTDYIKCTAQRITVQLVVLAWLLAQLIWGILIVWGR
jgi:succinate dehydrogenase / fumarate reductase membrane anchor subunit